MNELTKRLLEWPIAKRFEHVWTIGKRLRRQAVSLAQLRQLCDQVGAINRHRSLLRDATSFATGSPTRLVCRWPELPTDARAITDQAHGLIVRWKAVGMSNLSRRITDAVSDRDDHITGRVTGYVRPPARVERAAREGVAVEHARGLVAAARARALEYVAHEAMQAVANLSELEALHLRRTPLGGDRLRMIADTASVALANIVADTGRR